MIELTDNISLPEGEIEFLAIRAQGPGGQNVNKVSSAIQLRLDIPASSLPEVVKSRLLAVSDRRIGKDGVLLIKAQNQRTQERNRRDALARLTDLLEEASRTPKKRIATKPSRNSKLRRLDAKKQRSNIKKLRAKDRY